MTNPYDHNRANEEEEASPSMSRTAEDNLSNSDGPLLLSKKSRDLDGHSLRSQMHSTASNWHKSCGSNHRNNYYSSDDKKSNQCIWVLAGVLAFIAFCNLILNLTIMIVLRVTQGMEALEIIPERHLLKFYGNTDLDRVCLQNGVCEGFGDAPMELIGNAAGVHIQVTNNDYSKSSVRVLENETTIFQVKSFEITDSRKGSVVFSTDHPTFSLPKSVQKIELNLAQTHRIVAPKKSDLSIESDKNLYLDGAEGINLDSKDIHWSSVKDIVFHSKNGDIIINATDSINFPLVPTLVEKSSQVKDQYKVCICMPLGKLFFVPAHNTDALVNCARISRSFKYNPCA